MQETTEKNTYKAENDSQNNNPKESSSIISFVVYILFALIIVIPFRIFIAQPYIVSGSSMYPTFKDADYLIVDQISKRFETPKRGSVIIIINPKYPEESTKYFIKRLIGFPNEEIQIKDGRVSIKNSGTQKDLVLDEPYVIFPKNEFFNIKLKSDEYFVMGDNRAGSSDSRIWGPIKKTAIVGTPVLRLLPIQKISLLPGKFELK